jgi:putative ABC transport system ATP-binding protein
MPDAEGVGLRTKGRGPAARRRGMQRPREECCVLMQAPVVAQLRGAAKTFRSGSIDIVALKETDLDVRAGELLLIIGPSGSGKTTLLSLLGCVLYPTSGCVCVKGVNTKLLNEKELADLRLNEIGFVFQNFNLVAPLTSEENVMAPLLLQRLGREEVRERADEAIGLVGLRERRRSLPKQLSGGEQQRIAIARALVSNPSIVLCDEPTASLDSGSIEVVLKELRSLADAGKAVAIVTHDPRLEGFADRTVYLENGGIVRQAEKEKRT